MFEQQVFFLNAHPYARQRNTGIMKRNKRTNIE